MEALSPDKFLKQLSDHREAFWEKMTAERKSYGAEKPLTPHAFIERVDSIDPQTAAIYRDTLLADEAGHEWLAPEILRRYATDLVTQQRCLEALKKGCELFGRAIESFNRSLLA